MKLSVSLPSEDLAVIDADVAEGRARSRSEAIHLYVVRAQAERTESRVEAQFIEAQREWRESGQADEWDAVAGDGL